MEWIDTSKLHQFRCVVNPYLRHLEAQGGALPEACSKALYRACFLQP